MLLGIPMLKASAQVAVNTDNSLPDISSMLDVKSIDKGVLVPRMTTANRTAIGTPADGLLVYDTDTKTFWFFKTGTGWTQIAASGTGLTLPYIATVNDPSTQISITNDGDGTSLEGINNTTTSSVAAVRGMITSTAPGGFSSAVRGINNGTGGLGIGVWGSQNGSGWGVYGVTTSGLGVYGNSSGAGYGVYANSNTGTGLTAISNNGQAAYISIANNSNNNDVLTLANVGNGDVIAASTTGNGTGVFSSTGSGFAVHGATSEQTSAGIVGDNNGAGEAVVGRTTSDIAGAVVGRNDGGGYGVRGFIGTNTTGTGVGVFGQVGVNNSTGRAGRFQNTNDQNTGNTLEAVTNSLGDIPTGTEGTGAAGHFFIDNTNTVAPAIYAESNTIFGNFGAAGVYSKSSGTGGRAGLFYASNPAGNGHSLIALTDGNGNAIVANAGKDGNAVEANVDGAGAAVYGWVPTFATGQAGRFQNYNDANNTAVVRIENVSMAGNTVLVEGVGNGSAAAINATATGSSSNAIKGTVTTGANPYAIWGVSSAGGDAGHFNGDVDVVGTLSKTAGTFKIDHPQDPENKYLIHSFVESPDMMNVYNGNAVTNGSGTAVVTLPAYFEAENIDFKYQLTVIGQFAQAIVATEINNNQFEIKTDKPGVKVSWQVTGVRNDMYAQKYRIKDEVAKAPNERGYYLNPDAFGLPATKSIEYARGKMTKEDASPVTKSSRIPENANLKGHERIFSEGLIKKGESSTKTKNETTKPKDKKPLPSDSPATKKEKDNKKNPATPAELMQQQQNKTLAPVTK